MVAAVLARVGVRHPGALAALVLGAVCARGFFGLARRWFGALLFGVLATRDFPTLERGLDLRVVRRLLGVKG